MFLLEKAARPIPYACASFDNARSCRYGAQHLAKDVRAGFLSGAGLTDAKCSGAKAECAAQSFHAPERVVALLFEFLAEDVEVGLPKGLLGTTGL